MSRSRHNHLNSIFLFVQPFAIDLLFLLDRKNSSCFAYGNKPGYFRAAFGYYKTTYAIAWVLRICQFHSSNTIPEKTENRSDEHSLQRLLQLSEGFQESMSSCEHPEHPWHLPWYIRLVFHLTQLSVCNLAERHKEALTKPPVKNMSSEMSIRKFLPIYKVVLNHLM